MYPKDKSESYLMNNSLSETMSLGANLFSILYQVIFLIFINENIYFAWQNYEVFFLIS